MLGRHLRGPRGERPDSGQTRIGERILLGGERAPAAACRPARRAPRRALRAPSFARWGRGRPVTFRRSAPPPRGDSAAHPRRPRRRAAAELRPPPPGPPAPHRARACPATLRAREVLPPRPRAPGAVSRWRPPRGELHPRPANRPPGRARQGPARAPSARRRRSGEARPGEPPAAGSTARMTRGRWRGRPAGGRRRVCRGAGPSRGVGRPAPAPRCGRRRGWPGCGATARGPAGEVRGARSPPTRPRRPDRARPRRGSAARGPRAAGAGAARPRCGRRGRGHRPPRSAPPEPPLAPTLPAVPTTGRRARAPPRLRPRRPRGNERAPAPADGPPHPARARSASDGRPPAAPGACRELRPPALRSRRRHRPRRAAMRRWRRWRRWRRRGRSWRNWRGGGGDVGGKLELAQSESGRPPHLRLDIDQQPLQQPPATRIADSAERHGEIRSHARRTVEEGDEDGRFEALLIGHQQEERFRIAQVRGARRAHLVPARHRLDRRRLRAGERRQEGEERDPAAGMARGGHREVMLRRASPRLQGGSSWRFRCRSPADRPGVSADPP